MVKTEMREDARLDFVFDWAAHTNRDTLLIHDWLQNGDTISTFSVEVSPSTAAGVVESAILTDSNTSVTVWLNVAGLDVDTEFTVLCSIETVNGLKDSRTLLVTVVDKWIT